MVNRPFSTGWQLITSPQTLTTFLVGGLALGVLGNAVYQLLTNWLTTSNYAAIRIIIGSFLTLLFVGWFLSQLAHRLRPAPPLPNKTQPEKRKGIIFLVSNEPTIRKALEWHAETLRWSWLICSEQSMPLATRLKSELVEQGKQVEILLINDVFDPVECRNTVDSIYNRLPAGCEGSDVILDFTGMTAIASVGAVLACLDGRRAIQYTPGVFNSELKAVQPRDPVEIVLNWETFKSTTREEVQLQIGNEPSRPAPEKELTANGCAGTDQTEESRL